MKYSWSAVVAQLRVVMLKNVSFKCATKQEEKDMQDYFREMMSATDTFHPWNTDGLLSRVLDKLPKRCNYRSIKSYWAWKNGRERLQEVLGDVFEEMADNIEEWFLNPYNHPPGYTKPEVIIKKDPYDLGYTKAGKIIGSARKSG